MLKLSAFVALVACLVLMLVDVPSSSASIPASSGAVLTNAGIDQASASAATADAALVKAQNTQTQYAKALAAAKAALPVLQAAVDRTTAAEQKAYTNYQHATSANRSALKLAYNKSITARHAALANQTNGKNLYYSDGHRLTWANQNLANAETTAKAADALLAGVRRIYLVPVSGTSGVTKLVTPKLLNNLTFSGTKPNSNWTIYNTTYDNGDTTRLPANVSVSDGYLRLLSTGRSGAGMCLCGAARISKPYGSYQVRLRITANSDHNAAVMLWPDSENWPTDGEMDLAEFNGARTQALYTLHWGAQDYERHLWTDGDFTQWHTFRLDWTPRGIAYYVDGTLRSTATESQIIPRTSMHLSIQMGPTKKYPHNTSSTLQVAWVRTYAMS